MPGRSTTSHPGMCDCEHVSATSLTGRTIKARSLPRGAPRLDRLVFHNGEELAVYKVLKDVQASQPPNRTIGIIPGCGFRVVTTTIWTDFVITYLDKVPGIEVDGPHHGQRWPLTRAVICFS